MRRVNDLIETLPPDMRLWVFIDAEIKHNFVKGDTLRIGLE